MPDIDSNAYELLKKENQLLRAKLRLMMGESGDANLSLGATVQSTAKRFAMTIEGVNEGIVEFDQRGRVTYANRIVREILDMGKGEIAGRSWQELDLLSWAPGVFEALALEAAETGQPAMFEARRESMDGSVDKVYLFEARVTDKGSTHVVLHDITREASLQENFAKHVGARVLQKIMERGVTDDAERQEVSILFADLRGFTTQSSHMQPEAVRAFINDFLRVAMDVIDRYEGNVDKIVGDEVMGLFGAPLSQPDDPYRAVLCAVEMQRQHIELQKRYADSDKQMPHMGIGINTGAVVVGHIGSGKRVDYTVIGHHVNLAARLCSGAKGGQVLVGRGTIDAISAFTKAYPDAKMPKLKLQGAGTIQAKGIDEPVKVYEAL